MSCSTPLAARAVELVGGAAERPVAAAEAPDDRARPGEERVGVVGHLSVVHARRVEAAIGGEHQREPAAHAEPDHADLAGAVVASGEPRPHRVDVVEDATLAGGEVAERRHHARDAVAVGVEVGGDREIPVGGEPVGLLAGIAGHAERVVDDDHTGPRAVTGRFGEIPANDCGTGIVTSAHSRRCVRQSSRYRARPGRRRDLEG